MELNEYSHIKNLCDLYTKKYEEDKNYNNEIQNLVEKPDLIKTIISSKKSYIFFFIKIYSLYSHK